MTRDLLEWTLSREASALKFFLYVVQGRLTRARKSTLSSYTVILLRDGTSPSGPGFVRVLLCHVADQGTWWDWWSGKGMNVSSALFFLDSGLGGWSPIDLPLEAQKTDWRKTQPSDSTGLSQGSPWRRKDGYSASGYENDEALERPQRDLLSVVWSFGWFSFLICGNFRHPFILLPGITTPGISLIAFHS